MPGSVVTFDSKVFNLRMVKYGGILADVTEVLCELELTIKRVKVSTTPDGKVMDLFFVTDARLPQSFLL